MPHVKIFQSPIVILIYFKYLFGDALLWIPSAAQQFPMDKGLGGLRQRRVDIEFLKVKEFHRLEKTFRESKRRVLVSDQGIPHQRAAGPVPVFSDHADGFRGRVLATDDFEEMAFLHSGIIEAQCDHLGSRSCSSLRRTFPTAIFASDFL